MFLLFQFLLLLSLQSLQNLHSNMFLLFLACESSKMHSTEFHLHSNMFLLFPIFLSSSFYPTKIYIPICFYYFDGPADGVALTMEFTFQYVSIISLPEPVQNFVLILFTFQYVSIISSSSLNSLIVIIPIYIPICFYYFTRSE